MAAFEGLLAGLENLRSSLSTVADSARETSAHVGRLATQATETFRAAASQIEHDAERAKAAMREIEELAPRAATALDDLKEMADKWTEDGVWWASEIQVSIEALRVGALRLDEFMAQLGDAVVKTEQGTMTIRELLTGLDWTEYQRQIQDFIDGLRKGSVDLGEVMEYLTENAGQLTERLGEVFEKYRDGKVTLEHLVGVIQSLKGQFEGSELDALLDAVLDALARGDI